LSAVRPQLMGQPVVFRSEKRRTSFYLKKPISFEGPPGDWLFEVQIEDANDNLSNLYRFHVILR